MIIINGVTLEFELLEEDPPAAGEDTPAAGEDPPAAGEDPPAAGEDPPAAGEDLPAAGEDPPAAGEDPPAVFAEDESGDEEKVVVLINSEEIEDFVDVGGLVLEVPELEEEQIELILTPVQNIPEEKIFTPVPLVARLTSGVSNVKEIAKRQRENVTKGANSAKGSAIPPEARVKKFTNSGSLKMIFTSPLKIPDGVLEEI